MKNRSKKAVSRLFGVSLFALLFTLSLTVNAQESLICRGPEAIARWVADTEADSDITTSDAFFDFSSSLPNGSRRVEYVLFNVSAETKVRLEADTNDISDPAIKLFDSSGELVTENDDTGDSYDSLSVVTLEAGQYCLSAYSVDDEAIDMKLRIGRVEHEALNDHDTGASADDSCLPETEAQVFAESAVDDMLEEGLISSASVSQTPFYRFSIDRAQAITISANGESADPVLALFDSNGNTLAENDDYGSGYNSKIIMMEPLEPGVYCIGVRALDDDDIAIRTSLNAYDEEAARREQYDTVQAVPLLDGSHPISTFEYSGNLAQADVMVGSKALWYRVDVDAPSIYFFEAIGGSGADPVLSLFDGVGRTIAYNDDAIEDNYDSLLAARLEPGTYLLALNQLEETDSGLIRLIVERYDKK